jgi:hypothetical protein
MDHSASAATKDAARNRRRRSCTPPRFSSTLPQLPLEKYAETVSHCRWSQMHWRRRARKKPARTPRGWLQR